MRDRYPHAPLLPDAVIVLFAALHLACSSPQPGHAPGETITTSAQAPASTGTSRDRAQLVALLDREEGSPTPEELAAAVSDGRPGPLLAALAADPATPVVARNRAIRALGHHPSTEGDRVLRDLAAHAATARARRAAAGALERARQGGPPSP
jgi:hypothetical protein